MSFGQITIVGVGLIGGSVGLTAKARGVARRVVGVGRDRAKLEQASRLGAVDSATTDLAAGVRDATLVVVCTPVDRIAADILAAAADARPGTSITDGGSTKGNIVTAVDGRLPAGLHYVPAHPLAGAEKGGAEHARADLFDGRVTILTPTDRTDAAALERVEAFWRALGSRVVRMSPDDHDRVLATTSHLPHAVAAGVAGITPPDWLPLSAGGFRDVTRIAGGSPDLWVPIFRANREAVLAALDRFTDRLAEFRRLLEAGDGDGLARWLADAKQVRDALGA
ncbi:MAG: prephenate dehydrogenase/arogenate dehydrogenase family protein [Gemmataceae bacterium]|nr:prephenate dehydrogenase/arogenate dehydrogenase family protein [Gemmataceae bacterium]